MENLPVVSIITPVYNHGSYIGQCIQSVLAQTYPTWEMIIIDDGSTDNTKEIVTLFANHDKRIQYYYQENIGIFRLAQTYNLALSHATGKYIAILEGDDLWMTEKLERQVAKMEMNPLVVLAWGQAECVRDEIKEVIEIKPNVSSMKKILLNNDPPGSILNLLYIENPIPAVTIIIRKDVLLSIGGFQQHQGLPLVDLPTIMTLARIGPFWFDQHVLAKWREYGLQVTKTFPVEITLGRKSYSLDHYDSNPDYIRKNVSLNKKEMIVHYNCVLQIAYSRSGRYKLIRKDFKGARNDFIKVIFFKGFSKMSWRLRAILGVVLSFLRQDMETLASCLGRVSYKKR